MSVVGKASTLSIECDGELIMSIFYYLDMKETEADIGRCIQTRMVKEIVCHESGSKKRCDTW